MKSIQLVKGYTYFTHFFVILLIPESNYVFWLTLTLLALICMTVCKVKIVILRD